MALGAIPEPRSGELLIWNGLSFTKQDRLLIHKEENARIESGTQGRFKLQIDCNPCIVGNMSLSNVAIEYRIIVRYASEVPESELDNLVRTSDRIRTPERLLNSIYSDLQGFPGLLIEVYEDHRDAPIASLITAPVFRRTGT
jgi:hypothetical protein